MHSYWDKQYTCVFVCWVHLILAGNGELDVSAGIRSMLQFQCFKRSAWFVPADSLYNGFTFAAQARKIHRFSYFSLNLFLVDEREYL